MREGESSLTNSITPYLSYMGLHYVHYRGDMLASCKDVYNSRPAHVRQSTCTHIEPLLRLLVDHVCRMKTTVLSRTLQVMSRCGRAHLQKANVHLSFSLGRSSNSVSNVNGISATGCRKRNSTLSLTPVNAGGPPVIRPRHQGRSTAPGRGGPEPSPP